MAVSAFMPLFTPQFEIRGMDWFFWVISLWLMFPTGAFLGGYLMPRLIRLPLPLVIVLALCGGLLIGVGLTLCIVGTLNAHDIIRLVTNTGIGGGYASYRFSVLEDLREMTLAQGKGVIPVITVTLLGWAIINHRLEPSTAGAFTPKFQLRMSGWHAIWWLGVAAIPASLCGILGATQQLPTQQSFYWILGGAGAAVIGPWLGPLINLNASNPLFVPALLVALPIILLSLLPFMMKCSVTRSAAAIYWSIYITVMLAWTGLGLISAGMSMG
jgi:hypothetical protein